MSGELRMVKTDALWRSWGMAGVINCGLWKRILAAEGVGNME